MVVRKKHGAVIFAMLNKQRFCFAILLLTASLILFATKLHANPQGGQVIHGNATITKPTATKTVINQTTNKAIINWQSFNIQQNEHTHFAQPSSSSITLNRVVGTGGRIEPSSILGRLTATGQIMIINPAGILFGKNAQVDVAGLIATTADITNQNFLRGNYQFLQNPDYLTSSIINLGKIKVADTGVAALVAPHVKNAGVIQANLGKIVLGAATAFTLDMYGDDLIHFAIDPNMQQVKLDNNGNAIKTSVSNTGELIAKGGKVLLTAQAAEGVLDNVINMEGVIEANAIHKKGGEIVLAGSEDSVVQVSGQINARGEQSGQTGGTVHITGQQIGITDQAQIDVSGQAGGGDVLIGGGYQGTGDLQHALYSYVGPNVSINANALQQGNGGQIVVWSDGVTQVYGSLQAKGGSLGGHGGLIETSGHYLDVNGIRVDASALNGEFGLWLLDPTDITIDATLATTIENILNGGTNVTLSTSGSGSDVGDINVIAPISWNTFNSLTLNADNDISINAEIISSGGDVNLNAAGDVFISDHLITGPADLSINAGGSINMTPPASSPDKILSAVNVLFIAGDSINVNEQARISGTSSVVLDAANEINLNDNSRINDAGQMSTINLNARNAIRLNDNSFISPLNLATIINIHANDDGSGASNFEMNSINIVTGGNTANAITIEVNTLAGGDGSAILRRIATSGGGINVNTYNGGDISVGSGTGLTTSGGDINLNAGDDVILDGSSYLNSGSGKIIINANQDSSGADNFTMNPGSSITLSNPLVDAVKITVNTASGGSGGANLRNISTSGSGGGLEVITNPGGITTDSGITQANSIIRVGPVYFSTSGSIVQQLGATINAGQISFFSGDNISQNSGSVLNSSSLTELSAANNINLIGNNDFNSVTIFDANDVTINDVNAINLLDIGSLANPINNLTVSAGSTINHDTNSELFVTNDYTASSNGNITQNFGSALNVGNLATFSTNNNDVILNEVNNDFNRIVINNSANAFITDLSSINLAGLNITGDLNLTTGGVINNSGALSFDKAIITAGSILSPQDIFLNNIGNTFNSLQINRGADVNVYNNNPLSFDTSIISGDLNVTAGGAITDSGAISVAGTSTFNAGAANNITLDAAGNDFATVSIGSGNNVTLVDTNAINLGASTISGALNVTAGGAITDSGAISVAGTSTFNAGAANNITLDTAGNDFATVSIGSGNNVTLVDTNAIDLGVSTISGTLNVTAGGVITDSGALLVAGTSTFNAGAANNITLDTAGNDFATVRIGSGNNVTLVDANAIDLGVSTISGALNVTAGGAITDSGRLSVVGTATFDAGVNDITLDEALNNFAVVGIISGNNVILVDRNAISIGDSNVANALNVTAGGAITQQANSTINAGSVNFTPTGRITVGANATLNSPSIIFNNPTSILFDVDSAINTGTINLSTPGSITFNSGASLDAGAGTVTLLANQDGSGGQDFIMNAGSSISTNNIAAPTAVNIVVNTAAGGSGAAFLGNISTGGGGISVNTNIGDNIILRPGNSITGGSVLLSSGSDVLLDDNSFIDAGVGTVEIHANMNPGGNEFFRMDLGSYITTTNTTANAVQIHVNELGGTGLINLRNITAEDGAGTRGGITANTYNNGGNITILANTGLTGSDILLNAGDNVVIGSNGFINAGLGSGTGIVIINANQNALDANNFTMNSGSSIISASAAPVAVSINVNTPGGGSGRATLANITTAGGGLDVITNPGGITTDLGITQRASSTINVGDVNFSSTGQILIDDNAIFNAGNVVFSTPNTIFIDDNAVLNTGDIDFYTLTTIPLSIIIDNNATLNTGNVDLRALGAIRFDPGVTLNAGSGTINILANQDGIDAQAFSMNTGSSITTTNNTPNAVNIVVNTPTGGGGRATLRDISTGGGAISVNTNIGGDVILNQGTGLSGGNVLISSGSDVLLDDNSFIDAGVGTVEIHANMNPGGNEFFRMDLGSYITTTNTTANAVQIHVNELGGTGSATLRRIDTGGIGGLSVNTHNGGAITINPAVLPDPTWTVGNVDLNTAGTIRVNDDVVLNTNNVNFVTNNAVVFDPNSLLNAGTGTINILTNQDGSGGEDFIMNAGSSIATANITPAAVNIEVNTASGGTGIAALRDITVGDGGTITIRTDNGAPAGGDITQVTGLLDAGSGTIRLYTPTASGRNIGTSSAYIMTNAANIEAQSGSGGIYINNAQPTNIILANTQPTSGAYSLISNGAITQTGAVTIGGTTTLDAGAANDIILPLNNDFNVVRIISGNNVTLNDINDINLGTSIVSGIFNVTASGNIADSGALLVSGDSLFTAGGDITLNNANNFSTISLVSGNDATVNDIDSLIFGNTTVSNNLTVTTNGAITQLGGSALNVGNVATFSAGAANDITLDQNNDFATVSIGSGNNVTLNDIDSLIFGNTNVSNNLTVTTNGAITQVGGSALNVGNVATFSAGAANDITLDQNNDFATVSIGSGNNVTLNDINDINLGTSTVSGIFNVTASGNITDSGALLVSGDSLFTAGGDITLNNANNFSTISLVSGNDATVNDIDSLIFGNTTVSNNLTVTTNGAITQVGGSALNVGNVATLLAGAANDITLDQNNDFATVNIGSGNNVIINDINNLDFGLSFISGNLTALAGGDISQSGALSVVGNSIFNATNGSSIILDNANNNFLGTLAFNAITGLLNNVTLVNTTGVDLAPLTLSGDLEVTAGGAGINLLGDNITAGTQVYNSPVIFASDRNLTANIVNFVSTINGNNSDLVINGNASFAGDVSNLQSLTITGNAVIGADISTINSQTYLGDMQLQNNVVLTGSNLLFPSPFSIINGNGYDLTLNFSGSTIVANQAINQALFADIRNLTTGGGGQTFLGGTNITLGEQTYNDDVVLLGNTTLRGDGNITFGNMVTGGGFNLTLNSGTGDVFFNLGLGTPGFPIGLLTIENANNVVNNAVIFASAYTQSAGSGTTDFGAGGLEISGGNALVSTNNVIGRIVANSLSLNTSFANLTGLINGQSGVQGARLIKLLNIAQLGPGTHFFDGIDLFIIYGLSSNESLYSQVFGGYGRYDTFPLLRGRIEQQKRRTLKYRCKGVSRLKFECLGIEFKNGLKKLQRSLNAS